ncbi:hypothetical protein WM40_00930 [Robbsia andropogonis]|uniref:Uncharacterized protein n=1 Tax=Robbsia andropogonis TaxID=28092 RepID=A0A0F5K528_9BURK|nr:hypothetical protein [Robbsia andropogonis]KKB65231.1 hypothetical protein WM40_00930 [Robbsia andropogonis]MCP1117129.1 hypothetical protein [Robbsia andropogonis]MCP1128475.1 hypothetical protein [Robbsia andropogonis]
MHPAPPLSPTPGIAPKSDSQPQSGAADVPPHGANGNFGAPRTRAECDALTIRLTAMRERLRAQIVAGLPQDAFVKAQACVRALEAGLSFVSSLRVSIGPDTAHALHVRSAAPPALRSEGDATANTNGAAPDREKPNR